MAWPLIIRRFFSDRQFADLLAGDDAPVHRRAPDAGLTGLGWLLLASRDVQRVVHCCPQLVGGDAMRELQALMRARRRDRHAVAVVDASASSCCRRWAGFELIRMSPQSRIIATVFGAVGVGGRDLHELAAAQGSSTCTACMSAELDRARPAGVRAGHPGRDDRARQPQDRADRTRAVPLEADQA